MTAYYNEFDPYAAQWLRNLIAAGHIAPGVVDERSIVDVHPDDLIGFTQCHFFAGLGGWSYALRLAGWPDDRPVWTGSPPCQPFSVAGQQKGKEDERHLAPVWLNLVSERRPPDLFGEQVAAAVTKDEWLDDLQNHLEAEGYATGASVLPACSVGAPHIRQRIVFCAKRVGYPETSGNGGLADTQHNGRGGSETDQALPRGDGQNERLSDRGHSAPEGQPPAGPTNGLWGAADWLYCRDGKWRPVEPGTFPLVDGAAARVGRLRAYGNAIVPQVAAEYIMAYMHIEQPTVVPVSFL